MGDLGPAVGLGHRRRLEAVAAALTADGVEATLSEDGSVPPGAEVLVVDSYRFRADDSGRFQAGVVVAIDEIGRDLAGDLVVDPTPGASPPTHAAAGAVLAGAPYALVHPDFASPPPPLPLDAPNVLVTLGASPAAAATSGIAASIARRHPDVAVAVAFGPWVRPSVADGVRVVDAPAGLRTEIDAATLVVTAGGVTLLEACASARPAIAVCIADNQRRAITGLVHAGAAIEADVATVPDAVDRVLADPATRDRLAASARATIDGRGAHRVAAAIRALTGP